MGCATTLAQVTTYHISTMSVSERSALASNWVEGGGSTSNSGQHALQAIDNSVRDNDGVGSDHTSASSNLEESPPDMLETCEHKWHGDRLGVWRSAVSSAQHVCARSLLKITPEYLSLRPDRWHATQTPPRQFGNCSMSLCAHPLHLVTTMVLR